MPKVTGIGDAALLDALTPEAPPMPDMSEIVRLHAETQAMLAELRALREAPPVVEREPTKPVVGTGIENVPLPHDRDEFPKRFYSPKYLFLQVWRPDSHYPLNFMNGEIVVHNEYEEQLVRGALGRQATEMIDDMKRRRQCKQCGFSTMSTAAWLEHLSNGPHAM